MVKFSRVQIINIHIFTLFLTLFHIFFIISLHYFTLFFQVTPAPLHPPLTLGGHYTHAPPAYTSLYPTPGVRGVWDRFKRKLSLPQTFSSQLIFTLILVYLLIIFHLLWNAFVRRP